MTLNDPDLADIIKTATPVEIANQQFIIESDERGSCTGCYFFENQLNCPTVAVTYCTSNGGNILKLAEQSNK